MFDATQEIKARLPIEDLVGQYVQLKKIGRHLKGLCPFHSEKTPSFIVSPEKGIAYCFGCHKGGDVFKFLEEIEHIDFTDALKILAERAGVKLEQYDMKKGPTSDEKEQLLKIHELAAKFYEDQLWNTKDGEKVLDYLHGRGLRPETIKLFRLGYAPDSFEKTYAGLLKEGFQKKTLVAAGIVTSKDINAEKIYDRFRCRLMFPISDSMGRIVAFGGRSLQKEQEPKYLNSPESPIYHKSSILYGFHLAKPFMKEQKSALLVEGYVDAIAAYQAGLHHVIAVSGTALTTYHLRLLQPFIQNLVLGFDMDNAGQEATRRAFELTQDFDFRVKVLKIPSGKDIAEFAQTRGAEIGELFQQARPYGEYLLEHLSNIYGKEDIYAKRKILQEFFPFLTSLSSSLEKDVYIRRVAHDFNLQEQQIYDEIKNFHLPLSHPARKQASLNTETQKQVYKLKMDELLLGFLIEFPGVWGKISESLDENLFSAEIKPIYTALVSYYNSRVQGDAKAFIATLSQEIAEKAALLSLKVSELFGEWTEQAIQCETKSLIERITEYMNKEKAKSLMNKIHQAEEEGNKELRQQLIIEHRELLQKFRL